MKESIKKVKAEKLYEYLLALEGPRHPINTIKNLNKAADYIVSSFNKFGLATKEHEFTIKGFEEPFRNIEAWIGDGSKPEILILSHYDTVKKCPGANDNASGVALMLECARVLAKEKKEYNVRFISFSLEEGNPYIELECNKMARELGMTDENDRYTSITIHRYMSEYEDLFHSFRSKGNSYLEANENATQEMGENPPKVIKEYFKSWKGYYKELDDQGKNIYCVGSDRWLHDSQKDKKEIKGILCFDTIAYTDKRLDSQRFPASMSPKILRSIFETYKVDFDKMIADFLTVIASKGSEEIVDSFTQNASNEFIDLPYASAHFKIDYQQLAATFPDLLRSDHGNFWRKDIPGLFLSDSANFRFPYYHTPADTIDRLDFDFLTKVTKATIATVLTLAE